MTETVNWGPTIPEEWLKTKTTVAELQESAANPNNWGFGKEFVEEVKASVREGDELWFYESPQAFLAGEAGIVVIRDGEIVSKFVTMMS